MTPAPSFGDLLRRYRLDSGLTQETLAERAGLSARGISDLERGARHVPHRETVRLLADALGLDDSAREALEAHSRRPRRPDPRRVGASTGFAGDLAPPLVGRGHEMERLLARLEDALAGRTGMVLLAGEAGIGKTRLVEELAVEAAQRQMTVLWGRCWENEGAPPFWPWIEILRGVLRGRESLALRADLGPGAPLLAALLPEVRERLPDLPAAPLLAAGEARFQLFDSITTTLQNISRAQPVLLVLDDLHWADQPSLLLLQFFLQYSGGARVLIVGTYRDTELEQHHPLAEVLGSLRRESSFESLLLPGLTVAAVGDFINSYLDDAVATDRSALARALWQATEGNPLFVREELRNLLEDNRLLHDPGQRDAATWTLDLGLPQGVQDVIRRRLVRLTEGTIGLLTAAAVIGCEFDAVIVERSSGLDEADLDADLDEAQAAGVIEEIPGGASRYRFTHALFREVLYADLPARRRMRLHGKVAEALEHAYAHDLDARLSELAYHYGEAQAVLGPEKVVHYSLLAGEQALQSQAYEEGAGYFQRGLAATARRPLDGDQAALLFGLGRAQTATAEISRAHEVIASLTRAFDYYAEHDDVDRAVAVAECPVDSLPGQAVGAARLVARALDLVDPNSHAAGRLLSRYARMVAIEEGDYPAAAAACDRALAIARREGDIRLEIQALGNGAEADLNYLCWPEGVEKCLQAIDLASHADALPAEMLARLFASIILWLQGDLRQASRQAAALLARAEQLRDQRWRVSALWIQGTVARFHGDGAAARDDTDRGLALSPSDPRLLWTRVVLAHDAGDLALARSLLDRLLDVVTLAVPSPDLAQASTVLVLAIVADADLDAEKLRLGEAAAEAILSFPVATDQTLRVTWASLAILAVRRGDALAAARCYLSLASAAGTIIYEGFAADRLLGLLAATMGNPSAAAAHFEAALTFCRRGGCLPELAWTCHDFGALLGERGEPGDQERARELLDEALVLARELGMQPLTDKLPAGRASLPA